MGDLQQELATSVERTAEIVSDLQYALAEHGLGTEAWKALLTELLEQEARTVEVLRQLDVQSDDRLEKTPGINDLWGIADSVLLLYRERPELFANRGSVA